MTIVYPDPLPFKLRFLKSVTDALMGITPSNGYVSDLSDYDPGDGSPLARVFRGRAWFGDNDPLPMVSVLEGVSPADDVGQPPMLTTGGEHDWLLLIQGFVNDDPLNPTDPAYLLLADVQQRLAIEQKRTDPVTHRPNPFGFGLTKKNCVTKITIGSGVVRPADDVSAKAYFWLTLTVRVVVDTSSPYA